jgi:hypothetical protein
MGFFECIDNKEAAFFCLIPLKHWLQERGMKAMEGPINFGENDSFWGLLVEGFTPPSYGMNYHLPYYHKFFTDYGFETAYEQLPIILILKFLSCSIYKNRKLGSCKA